MAYYMPWYVSKPFSGAWGFHWTMNHFNPDTFTTNGQRNIASWYYPQVDPYDSDDPALLEYHVLLLKLGGVDGVIADWYGMDNTADYGINDQRTLDLFNWTRKAGLKFALCYEDQTIAHEIAIGFLSSSNLAVAHAQQTMLYAETNFFNDPSYLRWGVQPVLLNFGLEYFGATSNWNSIFSPLTNTPAFFTEDNRLSPAKGAFDWPPMWMSQTNTGANAGILTPAQLDSYLTHFEQTAHNLSWPAFISSAFPRYHDIYAQAGVQPSNGYFDDATGATFQNTLRRALTNSSAIAQLVTWNDYCEGTIIEPTVQYGFRDLGVVQNFRRQYMTASYPGVTNDLSIATRVYNARKAHTGDPVLNAELDRVFTNAVNGALTNATLQLTGIESHAPVIYNLSAAAGQLQFSIGGCLTANGVEVDSTTDPALATWQPVATLTPGTNAPVFTTQIAPAIGPAFFRARLR